MKEIESLKQPETFLALPRSESIKNPVNQMHNFSKATKIFNVSQYENHFEKFINIDIYTRLNEDILSSFKKNTLVIYNFHSAWHPD